MTDVIRLGTGLRLGIPGVYLGMLIGDLFIDLGDGAMTVSGTSETVRVVKLREPLVADIKDLRTSFDSVLV